MPSIAPIAPYLLTVLGCLLPGLVIAQDTPAETPAAAKGTAPFAVGDYHSTKLADLPRDAHSDLLPAVWELIQQEATAHPNTNEARAVASRPNYQAFYKTYAGWTAPTPPAPPEGRLRNLPETPTKPRFAITGPVWPAQPGEAAVCLWADDKLAAFSISADDNNAGDLPFWRELSQRYGGLDMTFNIIAGNIDGVVEKSRMGSAGTWAQWQQALDDGFHITSHSMTHNADPVPSDGWPGALWEAAESQRLLDAHLSGQHTRVFTYPGAGVAAFNILNNAWRPAVTRYFAAGRLPGRDALNQANQIDYLGIRATTGSIINLADPHDTQVPDQHFDNLFAADPAHQYHRFYRGWANIFTHFLNGGKEFDKNPFTIALAKCLDWADQHRADLWIGHLDDVALYGQERDTATLRTDGVSAEKIEFTLTSRMDPAVFDYPLTVKVRLPDGWNGVGARQDGKAVEAKLVAHEGAKFALVQVVPDRGQVVVAGVH